MSPAPAAGWPAARRDVLRRELEERACGALVVVAESARDHDLAPFVGPVHLGRAFAVLPRPHAGPPRLGYFTAMERQEAAATGLALLDPGELEIERLARELPGAAPLWAAVLPRALAACGVPPGRVAIAGHAGAGNVVAAQAALARHGWQLVDGGEIARLLRKSKGEAELRAIERAAAGTVAAFRRVAAVLAAADAADAADAAGSHSKAPGERLAWRGEPLTVGRLRQEIAAVLSAAGLEQPHGNIVAPGEQGAVPHTAGDDGRVLVRGETLVVDLYPKGELWADCTRTFCVGPPPEPVVAAHRAVAEALARAHQATMPGARAHALHEATCRFLADRGYPTLLKTPGTETGFVHYLGHGLGYELHEYPSFKKETGAEGLLEAGDVVTLEPGLYDEAAGWGVRLEDLVVVQGPEAGGNRNLTPLPYALDPTEWGESGGS